MRASRRVLTLALLTMVVLSLMIGVAGASEPSSTSVPETTLPALLIVPVIGGIALLSLQVLRKRPKRERRP